MSKEQAQAAITLSGIHVNLNERSVLFTSGRRVVAKLTLAPQGLIFQTEPEAPGQAARTEGAEKPATTVLTGRLVSKPAEGKPDSRGNPTATALLEVREQGKKKPQHYQVTFHRHTREIALALPMEAEITVEGYPHPVREDTPGQFPTFSVINLPAYPGKVEKAE
jgi:hypothetical protein